MLTLKQLRDWFDDVEKIIFDVWVMAGNIQLILNPTGDIEKNILKAGFFDHYMKLLRVSLVIQLCKLFVNHDKERRNFRKLFNRIRYDPYDKRLKNLLRENRGNNLLAGNKHELISLTDTMIPELEAKGNIIHRMKALRDRHFAHTDPGKELPDLSLEELLGLAYLSEEWYNTLNRAIFNKEFRFGDNQDWSVKLMISALAIKASDEKNGGNCS
jgi:hypothetical protein